MNDRKRVGYAKIKLIVLLLLVLSVVLSAVGYFLLYLPGQKKESVAPKLVYDLEFSLPALDGKVISLWDYRSKKVVHLVFWATWCHSCREEMQKLKELYYAIGERNYEILAINVGVNDSLEKVKLFQEKYQLPFKVLYDRAGNVADAYKVIGVPLNIIIDEEGKEIKRFSRITDNPESYFNQLFSDTSEQSNNQPTQQ